MSSSAALCTLKQAVLRRVPVSSAYLREPNETAHTPTQVLLATCKWPARCQGNSKKQPHDVSLLQYAHDGDEGWHGGRTFRACSSTHSRERTPIRRSAKATLHARQLAQRRPATQFLVVTACKSDVINARALGIASGHFVHMTRTPCRVQGQTKHGVEL